MLETATAAWVHDEKVIDWFAAKTNAQIILCGPLDITKADEILGRHRNIAAIVQGEYDKQVLRVIRGQRGVIAHDLLTVQEMDSLPYPLHDEVAVYYYDYCGVTHRAIGLAVDKAHLPDAQGYQELVELRGVSRGGAKRPE